MKVPIWSKTSPSTKQKAIGGALAGAIVGLESGVSWFVAGYPQILKDQLNPNLPRNGFLLADLGPAAFALYKKKKGASAKMDNRASGMLFYDLPKLLDQIAYNVAYQMGLPAARLGMRRTVPLTLKIRPTMTNGIAAAGLKYPQSAGVTGKYALKTNSAKVATSGGLGKYR